MPDVGRSPHRLVVDDVTKQFDGDTALSRVSFHVESGDRVAIVGPSGAGKTTLLRVANGALQPDDGAVTIDGDPVTGESVTLAYQGETLVDSRTALSNVLVGQIGAHSWLRGFLAPFKPKEPGSALELLDAVGLAEKARTRVDTLSAGERQRVAFARALVQDAPVVLADEPTANLDPRSRSNVVDVLDATADDRMLVTVLHDVDLALDRFERIIGLTNGRVAFDKPAEAVTEDELRDLFAAGASTPDSQPARDAEEPGSSNRVDWYG